MERAAGCARLVRDADEQPRQLVAGRIEEGDLLAEVGAIIHRMLANDLGRPIASFLLVEDGDVLHHHLPERFFEGGQTSNSQNESDAVLQ